MYDTLSAAQEALKTGATTMVAIVEEYLGRIKQYAHLNAFLEVYEEEALSKAKAIDAKLISGTAGRLAGMVVGIKDVLVYRKHCFSAGSKILEGFESQFTGTGVQRILEEDALIIGRQNCDEFAMGSSNENSAFGPVRNAANENRVPGGSSGGSAVAVQAGMCMASLGTDTGGSVRQPAAFCGVVGFKPTYSRISRHGLIAYASSFDSIGIFTNSVEDSALLLEIMAGQDEYDSTVSKKPVGLYSQATNSEAETSYRIAFIKETLEHKGLNEEIRDATWQRLENLKAAGHTVEAVNFPLLPYVLPTYYILTMAEASSNLSRFDGVRYGMREGEGGLIDMYKKTRAAGFGEEVRRRILLGTFVLSASYYDAYYTKAQKSRRLIRDATRRLLQDFDFLVSPTTPTTAFALGEHTEDPLEMYLADLFTVQASVAGLPAISIPNGNDAEGLPIGFQVVADAFEEEKLLHFAASHSSS